MSCKEILTSSHNAAMENFPNHWCWHERFLSPTFVFGKINDLGGRNGISPLNSNWLTCEETSNNDWDDEDSVGLACADVIAFVGEVAICLLLFFDLGKKVSVILRLPLVIFLPQHWHCTRTLKK